MELRADIKNYYVEAERMDSADKLNYREEFFLPKSIYMDGNSLGLAGKAAADSVMSAIEEWKTLAIGGWMDANPAWFYYPEKLGAMMAPLMGAQPEEVCLVSSTTVNLHAVVSTFYKPSGKRRKILADSLNFPSDLYALAGQCKLAGGTEEDLILAPSRNGRTLDEDELISLMDDTVALILLPGVLYRSGQLLNMQKLAAAANQRGIPIGFDCCHSAGAIRHDLDAWGVDFAVWCSYKYLNGGPGSPGFLYINRKHFDKTPGMPGWYGFIKTRQFDMKTEFDHQKSAAGWNIGTTSILSSAALFSSLSMFNEAGIDALREKSLSLTGFLARMIDEVLAPYGFSIGTPREDSRRGGHICLEHDSAAQICRALRANGVVPDYRPPNVIRLAPIALYNTYKELVDVVAIIARLMESGELAEFSAERETVS